MSALFEPTPHPVLPIPSAVELAQMDAQQARTYLLEREKLIRLEKEDPLRHGYRPWTFKLADEQLEEVDELVVMGQNKCGKTHWAADRVVRQLCDNPNRLWACFHASKAASVNQQQPFIHNCLPPEWRNVGKEGMVAYVKYTKQNGFTGEKFTLPNGSQCLFFNYGQDVDVLQGYELDGVWFDELVPLAFLEQMEFRVPKGRRLEIIVTFTPVTGYTPTVGRYLAGARIRKTVRAELLPMRERPYVRGCPPGHVPLLLQCRKPSQRVVLFPWGSNPYGSNDEIEAKLKDAPTEKILLRAYGWTTKTVGNAFAKFARDPHVISRARFEEMVAGGATFYCAADPAGGAKAWFIKWYAVLPGDFVIVYREWPSFQEYGEWALSPGGGGKDSRARQWDWRQGPAHFAMPGAGITRYKQLILEAEGWVWDEQKGEWDGSAAEPIEARVIDPRFGGMESPAEDEGTSIIALMGEEHEDEQGRVVGPAMDWIAAPGSRVEPSVQMIASRMDWREAERLTMLNTPKWFVVEDCEQSILAYEEFTGAGSDKDALKDIVDPDRYFVTTGLGYVEPGSLDSRSWGSGGAEDGR